MKRSKVRDMMVIIVVASNCKLGRRDERRIVVRSVRGSLAAFKVLDSFFAADKILFLHPAVLSSGLSNPADEIFCKLAAHAVGTRDSIWRHPRRR